MITNGFLLSLALYATATVLFAVISVMIYTKMGAKCLSKIIVSGRRIIMMMQPTTVWTCVTLVACFAGHADAFIYYEEGLCLESAYNKQGGLTCRANDVRRGFVSSFSGQTECIAGEIFVANVTVTFEETANAIRYDPGVYLGINGSNAFYATGNKCRVEVLGLEDNVTNSGSILDADSDICLDISDSATPIFNVNNLSVKCQGPLESATPPNGNSTISICYTYQVKQNEGTNNCTSLSSSCCGYPCITNPQNGIGRATDGGFTCLQPDPGSVSSSPNPTYLDHFLAKSSTYHHNYKSEMLL